MVDGLLNQCFFSFFVSGAHKHLNKKQGKGGRKQRLSGSKGKKKDERVRDEAWKEGGSRGERDHNLPRFLKGISKSGF